MAFIDLLERRAAKTSFACSQCLRSLGLRIFQMHAAIGRERSEDCFRASFGAKLTPATTAHQLCLPRTEGHPYGRRTCLIARQRGFSPLWSGPACNAAASRALSDCVLPGELHHDPRPRRHAVAPTEDELVRRTRSIEGRQFVCGRRRPGGWLILSSARAGALHARAEFPL